MILIGWKQIVKEVGMSRDTIKDLAASRGFPLIKINRSFCTTKELVSLWLFEQWKSMDKREPF